MISLDELIEYHRRLLTMDLEWATIAGCSFYAWARRSLIHLSGRLLGWLLVVSGPSCHCLHEQLRPSLPMLLVHFVAASTVLCCWYPSIGLAFPIRCSLLVLHRQSRSPSVWSRDSTFASPLSSSPQSRYHQLGILRRCSGPVCSIPRHCQWLLILTPRFQ